MATTADIEPPAVVAEGVGVLEAAAVEPDVVSAKTAGEKAPARIAAVADKRSVFFIRGKSPLFYLVNCC